MSNLSIRYTTPHQSEAPFVGERVFQNRTVCVLFAPLLPPFCSFPFFARPTFASYGNACYAGYPYFFFRIILSTTLVKFRQIRQFSWALLAKWSPFTCIILPTNLVKFHQIRHFRQTRQLSGALLAKWSLLSTGLAKFRRICHFRQNFTDWQISSNPSISSTKFCQICYIRYCMHFWTYLLRIVETRCFLFQNSWSC